MTLLAGDETERANGTAAAIEKALSGQFTAKGTGTVETLKYRTSAATKQTATTVWIGIYTDSAGQPGTLLDSAKLEGASTAVATWIEVTGLSVAVTEGTVYWIVVLGVNGTIRTSSAVAEGGTSCRQSSSTQATLTSAVTWGAVKAIGPLMMAALGTESGSSFSGSLAQLVGFRQSVSGSKVALGSISQATGLRQSTQGFKSAMGIVAQRIGFSQAGQGFKSAFGTTAQRIGLNQSTQGFKAAFGAVAQRVGFTQALSSVESFASSIVQVIGFRQSVSGRKVTSSSVSQFVGFKGHVSGSKVAGGLVRQVVGFIQHILGGEVSGRLTWPYVSVTRPVASALSVSPPLPAVLAVNQSQPLGVTVEVELE